MAGHSRWAQIKRKKGALDVKKGATLAKMAKIIMVAVRTGGGGDPRHNFQLRTAIDKAKEAGVPKANIERAIEKACGNDDESQVQELVYEGYLPGGIAVMVFTATDNNNRTFQELRTIFSKAGGEIGSQGCVSYMFEKRGEIYLEPSHSNVPGDSKPNKTIHSEKSNNQASLSPLNKRLSEDEIMAITIDAGAKDIEISDDVILVITEADDLEKISDSLTTSGLKILESRITRIPLTSIEVGDRERIDKALEAIEDQDDVIEVVSNLHSS